MTHQQVFQAFAAGREAEGSSVSSKRHQRDGHEYTLLYSYSTPIAVREPSGACYFDMRKYSVTTSKQQSQAMRECRPVIVVAHERFRSYLKTLDVYLGGAR